MLSSVVMLIILSLFLATAVWLVFLWAVRRGEFDDAERPKYRMLDDDEPSPPIQENKNDSDQTP